jgi:ABC-type nitrate/sulfonate/bicarbonate transport system ATPase subunit
MIEIDQVSKAFPQRGERKPTPALSQVSLSVRDWEFLCIIGPSGCGKTTLLKIVGGLVRPDRGEVRIDGNPVRAPGTDRGMVFQSFALLPWANVLENIAFGLALQGVDKQERRAAAQELIHAVGLAGFEQHYPRELSGGMQQRVGLARALAINPRILLMDEPFGSVDAQTRRRLQEDLMRICEAQRKTVIFVTHSMSEAVRLGDQVALMSPRPGTIVECLDIPLPRPRSDAVDRLPVFSELKETLWQRLKTMQEGEAARG